MPPGTLPQYQDDDEWNADLKRQAMDNLTKRIADMKAGTASPNNRGWNNVRATTAKLAEMLSGNVDRPVLDMTQLQGEYHFELSWATESSLHDHPSGVSIFTAVEDQLGLKLEPGNESLDMLVIDKAEKTPTGN